jgi:hypothetical protein
MAEANPLPRNRVKARSKIAHTIGRKHILTVSSWVSTLQAAGVY